MNDIMSFVTSNEFSTKTLRQFCDLVFREEKSHYPSKQIFLHIRVLNKNTNGALVKLSKGQYHILINPIPFRVLAKESHILAYFYLYTTILHEFYHIELYETKIENLDCFDFNHAMMLLEDYPDIKGRQVGKAFENILSLGKSDVRKKNYAISATELACNCHSLQKALANFESVLPKDRMKNIQLMLKSSEYLCNNIEIAYTKKGLPFSRFVIMVKSYARIISKNPDYLKKAPYLNSIFLEGGDLKSIDSVYSYAKTESGSFYSQFLFRLFLYASFDFTEAFAQCAEMKKLLENLSNCYIKETIEYLREIHMGEILLKKEVLEDNAAMRIKNVSRLQAQMKKYNMSNTAGCVYPLYVPT